jgi:hypothetical protein
MADETEMDVRIPPLPAGFCLSATSIHDLLTQIQVFFPAQFVVWNTGPDQPTVEQRSRPWHKTDPSTSVGVGDFDYSPVFGLWLKNHWVNNGGNPPFNERKIFIGSLTDLELFDGGSPGTVSPVTGPFYEVDTTFANLIPVGVGVFAPNVNVAIPAPKIASAGAAGTDPGAMGVYFVKATGRIYDVG